MKMSVSVIMPHYNALDTIGRSIESVIAQTMPVHELIIVDDASEDFEALSRLIEVYSSRLKIVLVSLGLNRGAAHARNIGISRAFSKYVAFLDSDDVWHPNKIAIQYSYMEANSFYLTGHSYVFDLGVQSFGLLGELDSKVITRKDFLWGNPFFTPTIMALKNNFVAFDERHRRVDDYKCWYENLKNGQFALLNCNLAGGYKHPVGSSGLSGSIRLMHESYLVVLRNLYDEKKLSLFYYSISVFVEVMKYPVRIILIRLRDK